MSSTRVRFLTVPELSKYLGVHKTAIYRMLREGKLPGFRVESDWRLASTQGFMLCPPASLSFIEYSRSSTAI
jgi:excisionase family DNA binding protein